MTKYAITRRLGEARVGGFLTGLSEQTTFVMQIYLEGLRTPVDGADPWMSAAVSQDPLDYRMLEALEVAQASCPVVGPLVTMGLVPG